MILGIMSQVGKVTDDQRSQVGSCLKSAKLIRVGMWGLDDVVTATMLMTTAKSQDTTIVMMAAIESSYPQVDLGRLL